MIGVCWVWLAHYFLSDQSWIWSWPKNQILSEAFTKSDVASSELLKWDSLIFTYRIRCRGHRIGPVCLCVCQHSHGRTVWPTTLIFGMVVCVCLSIHSKEKDFWAKGLYNYGNVGGTWTLRRFHVDLVLSVSRGDLSSTLWDCIACLSASCYLPDLGVIQDEEWKAKWGVQHKYGRKESYFMQSCSIHFLLYISPGCYLDECQCHPLS